MLPNYKYSILLYNLPPDCLAAYVVQASAAKMEEQKNNPLHGKTLERILVQLIDYYGWDELGYKININSFNNNPSINSSLKFLRKTPWARQKVEELYIRTFDKK